MQPMRFTRGELPLINTVDAESFTRLAQQAPSQAYDAGPSLESEMMWFNQNPNAPFAEYKKAWFRSKNFRRAISAAINRADLCRVVYFGHAQPAAGAIFPAHRLLCRGQIYPRGPTSQGTAARF